MFELGGGPSNPHHVLYYASSSCVFPTPVYYLVFDHNMSNVFLRAFFCSLSSLLDFVFVLVLLLHLVLFEEIETTELFPGKHCCQWMIHHVTQEKIFLGWQ